MCSPGIYEDIKVAARMISNALLTEMFHKRLRSRSKFNLKFHQSSYNSFLHRIFVNLPNLF
jgi:hypothetical protein